MQISGRLIQIALKTKGPDLIMTNALAQHTWVSGDEGEEDAYEIRQDSFQIFMETLLGQQLGQYHVVVGDENTRLHARLESETDVLGLHIFEKGPRLLRIMQQEDAC